MVSVKYIPFGWFKAPLIDLKALKRPQQCKRFSHSKYIQQYHWVGVP